MKAYNKATFEDDEAHDLAGDHDKICPRKLKLRALPDMSIDNGVEEARAKCAAEDLYTVVLASNTLEHLLAGRQRK